MNALSTFTHHGMIFVPLGYNHTFPQQTNLTEVHGGMPILIYFTALTNVFDQAPLGVQVPSLALMVAVALLPLSLRLLPYRARCSRILSQRLHFERIVSSGMINRTVTLTRYR